MLFQIRNIRRLVGGASRGNVTNKIVLLAHAISDTTYQHLKLNENRNNQGGISVADCITHSWIPWLLETNLHMDSKACHVTSITLDDTTNFIASKNVILKIDIGGYSQITF